VPINFREQQRQVQNYDYLIYVCGVEVSAYTEGIEVTRTDRSAPGSVSITFANPFDQWVLTRQNLKGAYRMANDRYSEAPKAKIYRKKKNLSARLQIKRKSPATPDTFGGSVNAQPGNLREEADLSNPANVASEEFLQRYAFGPGSCIFSKLDPVKIFIRNPYSDPDTTDQWIPFFTGTIDTKPLVTDYISGMSKVTVNCFDIRASMQGMRIAVNPYKNDLLAHGAVSGGGASSKNVISFTSDSVGFFKDYYPTNNAPTDSVYNNIFAGKTFVDAVSMIITGQTGWVNSNKTNTVKEGDGVGEFQPGEVFRYVNPQQSIREGSPKTDLSSWDLLCLFGAKRDYWTAQECKLAGENSFYDGTGHPFTGKLHWLLPGQNLVVSSLIEEQAGGVTDICGSPDWTDRYSLLVQMANQIDYQFTVTGTGDIVFEFPMYDFHPDNFAQHPGVYQTLMHVKNDSISDEGGEVLAGLECVSISSQLGKKQATQALNATATQLNVPDWRVVVFSNVLASKYGARIQNVSFTGVVDEEAMKRLAVVEFQKRLAEANKLSLTVTFRPFLMPNRPFLYAEPNRTRLGRTTSISYAMTMFQEPTMSLGLGCVRLPLYNAQTGQISFQHIMGSEAMAFSYIEILEMPSNFKFVGNGDRGIAVKTVDTPTADGVSLKGAL